MNKYLIFFILSLCEFFILTIITNVIFKNSERIGIKYNVMRFSSNDDNESCGLNILIRILFPTIYLVIVSGILYNCGYDNVVKSNIFIISIFYYIIRVMYIIFILRRKKLQNWKSEFAVSIIGISLSYIVYESFISKTTQLFISIDELRSEIWFAIIAFVFIIIRDYVYNNAYIDNEKNEKRKEEYIIEKYFYLKSKYYKITNKYNTVQNALIYSIMIYENYNRPRFFRFFEHVKLFIHKSATVGIMQVKTNKNISEKQSVELGCEKIEESYKKFYSDKEDYLRDIILDYNDSTEYADEVKKIYDIIMMIET